MNATLGTILSLIVAAFVGVGYPMMANRRKNKVAVVSEQSVDSRAVALMFKDERDRLQIRINAMQAEHERYVAALKLENERALVAVKTALQAQQDSDKKQIDELRDELQGLYKQLYMTRPREQP
jgi:hypothetical protein